MNRNFDALRRILYGLWLDPFAIPFFFAYMIFLGLALAMQCFQWLLASLICVCIWKLLQWAAARGRPSLWARELTLHFYAVRGLGKRWSILQRRTNQSRTADCSALLKDLLGEQRRLPAALLPGRYRALTHDTVLRRLRAMDDVRSLVCIPAYTAGLAHIRSAMTGGRCRRCTRRCPFPDNGMNTRQFYFITFQIGG